MQIWDMRNDRPTSRTSGSSAATTTTDQHAGRADLSSQCLPGAAEPEGAGHPRRALGGARALLQRRGAYQQGQLQQHEEDELDRAVRRGLVMFQYEQVLHDADADAGHEGDGQAHHAPDQRGQQRQEQEPGAEHLGEGARLVWARRGWP